MYIGTTTSSFLRSLLLSLLICSITGEALALDARPGRWCGWYARHFLVSRDPGVDYNLAANWKHWGRASAAPCSGCMIVWSWHVGKITGPCAKGMCVVTSGNVNGGVYTGPTSIRGAVFRTY